MSSSRRGGQRSGTNREKGRTRDQLYEEARSLGVEGRSKMNKSQLRQSGRRPQELAMKIGLLLSNEESGAA